MLLGQRLVPEQIQAEWAEYQLIFSDLLSRQSALLARHAKAEKKRLERLQESHPSSQAAPQLSLLPSGLPSRKSELRARAADLRGLGPLRASLAVNQSHTPPPPEEESPE